MKVLIEVCCGSLDDAVQAKAGGADRIELVASHQVSGLTPSLGALVEVKKLKLPVVAMLRPRAGGFAYTKNEVITIMKDAELLLKYGADGVVFGFLHPDGSIDKQLSQELMRVAKGVETVFHRGFDLVPDAIKSLDTLMELGVTRVLTSGLRTAAEEGVDTLKKLVKHANGSIQILAGGGIREHNVKKIVESTGITQVHFGYNELHSDISILANKAIAFNRATPIPEDKFTITSAAGVRRVVDALSI